MIQDNFMKPKKVDYNYVCSFIAAEKEAVNFPSGIQNTQETAIVATKNHELYSGNYDINHIRIWIIPFEAFANKLLEDIRRARLLRSALSQKWDTFSIFIAYLVEEYTSWLGYMKTKKHGKFITPLKTHFTPFFSTYNSFYYLDNHIQKKIRKYNYKLNPLISYWFYCQKLEVALNLPQFSIFLPEISFLSYLKQK